MHPAPAALSRQISLKDWSLILLLGVIWGGSFFCARIAVQEVPPLVLVMFRVVIAASLLQLYLFIRNISFRPALDRAGSFLALSILNNVIPFSLIFLGQTELGAGLSAVLNATTPFWTAILANMLTKDEKLSGLRLAGIVLGITGTAIMIGPGLFSGLGGPIWAKLCLIGAAISYGLGFIFARRFKDIPAPVVATGQLTGSSLITLPLVLIFFDLDGMFSASAGAWAAIFVLAVIATAFAYIIYFQVLASAGATNTSLVTLIVPATAILLGAIFLGERLESFEMIGMGVIVLGLLTIDGRLARKIGF